MYQRDGDDGGSDDDDDDSDDSDDDGDGDDGVPNAEDEEGIAQRDGAEFAVASDVQLQAWEPCDMLSDESLAPRQPPSPPRALLTAPLSSEPVSPLGIEIFVYSIAAYITVKN